MWTEAELRELARRRAGIVFVSVTVGSAVMLVAMAWIGSIRERFVAAVGARLGDSVGELALLVLMASTVLFFLAGLSSAFNRWVSPFPANQAAAVADLTGPR